jgi:hypothetical protein
LERCWQQRALQPVPWFEEGHAEWSGLQVSERVAPVLAATERSRRAEEFRKLDAAHLGAWGGISKCASAKVDAVTN